MYNGQKSNPLPSDGEYIYFNICIEDMNVTEETQEVGAGPSILLSQMYHIQPRFFYLEKLWLSNSDTAAPEPDSK